MGGLLALPLACAGSCLASCACTACTSICSGTANSSAAKLFYYIFVFISSLLALLLRYSSVGFLDTLLAFAVNDECNELCLEVQAAYRVCMALFAFFVCMAVFASVSNSLHLGHWILKVFLWSGLIVVSFFVPESVTNVYVDIARGGAGLFLLMQLLVLITMAYEWNRRWSEGAEKPWLIAILAVSSLLILGSMVFWGFFYAWFTESAGGSCSIQSAFITITVVVSVGFTLVSVTDFAPHGALLTSAVLMLYSTFVLYTGLSADPSLCNRFLASSTDSHLSGLFLAALTLAYRCFSFSRNTLFDSDEEEVLVQENASKSGPGAESDVEMNVVDAKTPQQLTPEEQATVRSTNLQFHALLALSAFYVTMVVSNWGTADVRDAGDLLNVSNTVKYVNLITGWVSMALYTWTLVAPRACPGRDFGVDLDE